MPIGDHQFHHKHSRTDASSWSREFRLWEVGPNSYVVEGTPLVQLLPEVYTLQARKKEAGSQCLHFKGCPVLLPHFALQFHALAVHQSIDHCVKKHLNHWQKLKANRLAQQKPSVNIPIRTPAGGTSLSHSQQRCCTSPYCNYGSYIFPRTALSQQRDARPSRSCCWGQRRRRNTPTTPRSRQLSHTLVPWHGGPAASTCESTAVLQDVTGRATQRGGKPRRSKRAQPARAKLGQRGTQATAAGQHQPCPPTEPSLYPQPPPPGCRSPDGGRAPALRRAAPATPRSPSRSVRTAPPPAPTVGLGHGSLRHFASSKPPSLAPLPRRAREGSYRAETPSTERTPPSASPPPHLTSPRPTPGPGRHGRRCACALQSHPLGTAQARWACCVLLGGGPSPRCIL